LFFQVGDQSEIQTPTPHNPTLMDTIALTVFVITFVAVVIVRFCITGRRLKGKGQSGFILQLFSNQPLCQQSLLGDVPVDTSWIPAILLSDKKAAHQSWDGHEQSIRKWFALTVKEERSFFVGRKINSFGDYHSFTFDFYPPRSHMRTGYFLRLQLLITLWHLT